MNIIEIAGHLGADPEVRFTSSGMKVTNLRVAARGRRQDETIWWRVTIWGDRFDKMVSYFKKGSSIICIGEMHKPEIFAGRDGNQNISLEMTAEIIKFSPFGKSENQPQQQGQFGQQAPAPAADPFTASTDSAAATPPPAPAAGFPGFEPAPESANGNMPGSTTKGDGLPF